MNWNRFLVGIAIAIVVGLIASSFVYRQLRQATIVQPVATTKVVVAAVGLPLGTRLQPQYLREVAWPAGDPLPGMLTKIDDAVNRALITNVVQNEPILEAKLAPKEGGAGLQATIPEGMRALSVRVDEVVGVAGFVLPGTMVDVLVTGSAGGRGAAETLTRAILENIRVLAAGQSIETDREGKPQKVSVVTVLLTPEDANKLTLAANEGRIQLDLRNTIDTKMANPPAIHRTALFAGGGPAAPRRVAPASPAPVQNRQFVVEVIRGDKRETKAFNE